MKKLICLLIALVLCVSMAVPAFAVNVEFIPSPYPYDTPSAVTGTDEDGNEYIGIIHDQDGNILDYVGHGCLKITPVAHVWDPEKVVPVEIEEILLFIYNGLKDKSIILPFEKFEDLGDANMKVRDICDVRWGCEEHAIVLDPIGVTMDIIFNMGFNPEDEVYVLAYYEETDEWVPIVETVNNGDGTITCTLEDLTPLTFSVKVEPKEAPAEIGDVVADEAPESGSNAIVWVGALALIALIAVFVVMKNKKKATAAK